MDYSRPVVIRRIISHISMLGLVLLLMVLLLMVLLMWLQFVDGQLHKMFGQLYIFMFPQSRNAETIP